jgi:hypothetical protein
MITSKLVHPHSYEDGTNESMLSVNISRMFDLWQIFKKTCMLSLGQDCALHSGYERTTYSYFVHSVIISRLTYPLATGNEPVHLFMVSTLFRVVFT